MSLEHPCFRSASLRWSFWHHWVLQSLFLLAVTAAGLLTGCNDRKARQLVFSAKEAQLIEGYYDADVKVAEKALLDMSQLLREAQKQEVEKRHYNWTLGLTHGRLALLYRQLGRNAEAEKQFSTAITHMDDYVVRRGGDSSQRDHADRRDELIKVIDVLDRNRQVKWKLPVHTPIDEHSTNRNGPVTPKP